MSLIKKYFELTNKYKNEYGDKCILLMQVGAFFEVYGKKYKTNIFGSCIQEFSKICELHISMKSKVSIYDNERKVQCNVMMAGFRDYMINKYTNKLTKEGYTIVIYKQNDENPSAERELLHIISPGTDFDTENNISNMLMCVKIFVTNPNLIEPKKYMYISYTLVDIITGNVILNEIKKEYFHNPTTFDEVERVYSVYSPVEFILIYDTETIKSSEINDILMFIGVRSRVIRKIDLNDRENIMSERCLRCESEVYQKELMEKFYDIKDYQYYISSTSLEYYPCLFQCFVFLLDYVYQHNPNLIYKIKEPKINKENHLILSNHSLKQLNIINDSTYNGPYSSVLSLLNKCVTTIGKREFKEQLLNPIIDKNELEKKYDLIDFMLQHIEQMELIRENLNHTIDVERFYRKIILSRVKPTEFIGLKNTIDILNTMVKKDISSYMDFLSDYIQVEKVIKFIQELNKNIYSKVDIRILKNNNESCNNFTLNFFKQGIYPEIDTIQREYMESFDRLECIREYLTSIIQERERKINKELCKLHETDKNGYYIKLTVKRGETLKQQLKKIEKEEIELVYKSSYSKKNCSYYLNINKIKIERKGNDACICGVDIERIANNIHRLKEVLKKLGTQYYKEFLTTLIPLHSCFHTIIKVIRVLDVNITKAIISKKYNYCKPTIKESYSSFIHTKGLRHALIERINQEECYVPNDIYLDNTNLGFLLFGTNAVGKSSLIKSIGISVIIAQAGMFVPCSSFVFYPFKHIFTRIIGNDNIFKGLSTFAVEMSELRTILKYSDKDSLVLGDELCSGTENGSAISIFASGLFHLHKSGCKFIFASHFHEITKMNEIKELKYLSLKHLSVVYDRSKECLIYNRKLEDGPGDNMYGLEVCKSLHLPETFLDVATNIRMKYYGKTTITDRKVSSYNCKKILNGSCELCGEDGDDIHHLQYQKDADQDGYIEHIHKNHTANLIRICKKCHQDIHKSNTVYRKRKTTDGIKLFVEK